MESRPGQVTAASRDWYDAYDGRLTLSGSLGLTKVSVLRLRNVPVFRCCTMRKMYSTTLDWVHGLQPEDLEKFLAEKKEQRMRVLCLDLEPTGIPQQALRDDDEVVRAAHSLRSASSPTSLAQPEPFDGADDDMVSGVGVIHACLS